MGIYKSTKSIFFIVLVKYVPYTLYSIFLLSMIREYTNSEYENNRLIVSIVILSIMFGLLIWFVDRLLKTNYRINGNILIVNSGFTISKIHISNIQSLAHVNHPGYGLKFGFDFNGLKLIYESGRMMYITPEKSEEFISDLRTINEKIIIQ